MLARTTRSTARLAQTANVMLAASGASASSISPILSGTGDAVAEKLTVRALCAFRRYAARLRARSPPLPPQEDAKDILLASLNAADPRVGINQAVRAPYPRSLLSPVAPIRSAGMCAGA